MSNLFHKAQTCTARIPSLFDSIRIKTLIIFSVHSHSVINQVHRSRSLHKEGKDADVRSNGCRNRSCSQIFIRTGIRVHACTLLRRTCSQISGYGANGKQDRFMYLDSHRACEVTEERLESTCHASCIVRYARSRSLYAVQQ